jgi:hypothetical protein
MNMASHNGSVIMSLGTPVRHPREWSVEIYLHWIESTDCATHARLLVPLIIDTHFAAP